jgi:hypothetical protein
MSGVYFKIKCSEQNVVYRSFLESCSTIKRVKVLMGAPTWRPESLLLSERSRTEETSTYMQ